MSAVKTDDSRVRNIHQQAGGYPLTSSVNFIKPVVIFRLFIFVISFLAIKSSNADVPYIAYKDDYFLGDIEAIGSLEYKYNLHWSFLFWGGGAISHAFISTNNAIGLEAAVEPRFYFDTCLHNSGLFASGYLGNAYMALPEYYRGKYTGTNYSYGITYGFKIGCKIPLSKSDNNNIGKRFSIEPYISLAKSYYWDYGFIDFAQYPITTFGVRFVWEKCSILRKHRSDTFIDVQEVK
jgi:hypothetical protein